MDSGNRRSTPWAPHASGRGSQVGSTTTAESPPIHLESPGAAARGASSVPREAVHPYAYGSGGAGEGRKHSPPAFHANGSPRHGPGSQGGSPAKYVGEGFLPPDAAAPERAKLAQVQNVAAAVESGLRKQRDQLQLQLDKAAQREAILEARVSELEEKLLLEDSVWSELALDPRMTPEAMALQLRRANEMQMWAERAEHDERQARIAAEEALQKLARERDVAQQQLARAQALLGQAMDTSTAAKEVSHRLSQPANAAPSARTNASAVNDVSPLVSSNTLRKDVRAEGRERLAAAMKDAYHRAGVDAGALKQPRQRSEERSSRQIPVAESSPYTPRPMEAASSLSAAVHNKRPSPPFDIDDSGRLLMAPSFPVGGQDSPSGATAENMDRWSSDDEDFAGGPRGGMEGGGARQGQGQNKVAAAIEPRMGAGSAQLLLGLKQQADRDNQGTGRLSVLAAEQGAAAASGGATGVATPDSFFGSQGPGSVPQQGPGSGGRSAGPPPAWWRGAGPNSNDDASEYDDLGTAAGTLTYGNENNEANSDDTGASISDEAAGSSDDDFGTIVSPSAGQEGGADELLEVQPAALGGNNNGAPRMGGPTNDASSMIRLRRPSREKNLTVLLQSSSPPSSFGQLLCSLPEAKPITQFPVPLDHTSSPPSSARNLAGWGANFNIPAFPGVVDENSDEDEELFARADDGSHGPAAPSSTDSLIQGAPCGAYQRGGPQGVRLEPKAEASLSDVSPWPSATSVAGLRAAFGAPASEPLGEGLETPLPSVSSAASSLAAVGARTHLHEALPRPVLQPMSVSAMPDVSPWPSTTSLADAHTPSSQQGQGAWGGAGVAGRVGMAPLSGNLVDMSPFPSATGASAFWGAGSHAKSGAVVGGGGKVAPMSGSLLDVSPFPSSSRLHGQEHHVGGGAAAVLRQAADALSDHLSAGAAYGSSLGEAAASSALQPNSPSPLIHGRGSAYTSARSTRAGPKNLLPNPSTQINMLPSPSDALDETLGHSRGASAVAPSPDRHTDGPPVSGIIFTPSHAENRASAPQGAETSMGSKSTGATPHAQSQDCPPVSGIIYTPSRPAAGISGRGERNSVASESRGGAGVPESADASLVSELIERVAASSGTNLFEALKELHGLLQGGSAPKGSTSGPAAAIRQEVLASTQKMEQVVAGCAHGLSAAADDIVVAQSAVDVLAVLAADVAARQVIIVVLQRQEAAAASLANVLASFSPSTSLSPSDWITQHHVLMVVGNLAIDPVGRQIVLSQDAILQHLVRMLWVDTHQDAPNAVKALRFTTGALRSLVLDSRGKDLLLNGAFVHSGPQVLNRLNHLQVIGAGDVLLQTLLSWTCASRARGEIGFRCASADFGPCDEYRIHAPTLTLLSTSQHF